MPSARAITRLLWILRLLAAGVGGAQREERRECQAEAAGQCARWNPEVIASGGGVWLARR